MLNVVRQGVTLIGWLYRGDIEVTNGMAWRPVLVLIVAVLAFYLPGHPRVYCGGHPLGRRKSQYDYFDDTNLYDSALVGRPVVLYGSTMQQWSEAFKLDNRQSAAQQHRDLPPDHPAYRTFTAQV